MKNNFAGFDLPVVIMAGGLGSRLKPLTNVPKPLIPINEKTRWKKYLTAFLNMGQRDFIYPLTIK